MVTEGYPMAKVVSEWRDIQWQKLSQNDDGGIPMAKVVSKW
jgi:hypothetical protein